MYRVVQENLETFLAEVEAGGAASLPVFVKDEFDEFLDYNFDEIIDLGDTRRLLCEYAALCAGTIAAGRPSFGYRP